MMSHLGGERNKIEEAIQIETSEKTLFQQVLNKLLFDGVKRTVHGATYVNAKSNILLFYAQKYVLLIHEVNHFKFCFVEKKILLKKYF